MTEQELLQLKELLLKDAVEAIKQQNEEHQRKIEAICAGAVSKVDTFDARIKTLETQKLLVIKGAVVYATVVAALVGWGVGWLKQHLFPH
jgi:hypothetical protein